jgi:hypothetical protein
MSDDSGIPELDKPSRSATWLFCIALLFGGVIGFREAMSRNQLGALGPIVCGLILLSLCLTKLPAVKPLKPTLGMLAVSVLMAVALDMMLADQGFCAYVGHRTAAALYRLKFIFMGMGLGAALLSLFYGHWAAALRAAQQSYQSNAARDKPDMK